MIGGYILINIAAGKGYDVLQKLRAIPDIRKADLVTGLHDIVAFVETNDLKKLTDDLMEKIRKIDGVTKTVTCIAVS